jgi:hypothetical protein
VPTDPCNPVAAGFPEDYAGTTLGLDNAGFSVTNRVRLGAKRSKPLSIRLVVKSNGVVPGIANATVVGVQDEIEVYGETLQVSNPVGNRRTSFNFAPSHPDAPGDVLWTVTIDDENPDADVATATTRVLE